MNVTDCRWLGAAWRCSVLHAVLMFDGPVELAVLQQLVLSRVLPQYPRLTHRLHRLPLTGYCWLPDPHFHIHKHVFQGPCLSTDQQVRCVALLDHSFNANLGLSPYTEYGLWLIYFWLMFLNRGHQAQKSLDEGANLLADNNSTCESVQPVPSWSSKAPRRRLWRGRHFYCSLFPSKS